MGSNTLPIFLFAPGAWHQSSCFDIVRAELASLGYETEAIAYPSVGAEPPNKTLADDVAAARVVLEGLVAREKEVVLICHSYGGAVAANAVEGLGRRQRAEQGKNGGVIMFVYMSAFVVPKGMCLMDQLGNQWLPWMECSEVGASRRSLYLSDDLIAANFISVV
jgi:pimeloyl-ACP methyl ester carboxylesterase